MRTATTAEARVDAALTQINLLDPTLNAFTTVFDATARQRARELDAQRASGEPCGVLHGIPVAVKDNMDVAGTVTTCGVRGWRREVAADDADVVRRVIDAGGIIIGKTNMDPLAWGGTGMNDEFGNVMNPLDPESFAAGSSAGSAVAVASGMVPIALGSDTGGSIRLPASVNGVVGLRPTVGRVSSRGVTPLASSFDAVGPIAGTIAECESAYLALVEPPVASVSRSERVRIGITCWFFENTDPEVEHALSAVIEQLTDGAFEIVTLQADWLAEYFDPWLTIHLAEPAIAFERELAEQPDAFPVHVRELLERGAEISKADLQQAMEARVAYRRRCAELFEEVDLLLCPTMPFPAIAPGAMEVALPMGIAGLFEALPRYTGVASMAGLPALSFPIATASSGVGIGAQLIAPWFAEHALFAAAHEINAICALGGRND